MVEGQSRTRLVRLSTLVIALVLLVCLPTFVTLTPNPIVERMIISDFSNEFMLHQGESGIIAVQYNDTWHGIPISNATVLATSSNVNIVEVDSVQPDEDLPGMYLITILGKFAGSASLTVNMSKPGYETQIELIMVTVFWVEPPRPPYNLYGLPIFIIIMTIVLVRRNRNTSEDNNLGTESNSDPTPDDVSGNIENSDG